MVLSPPLAPTRARIAKSFPMGEEWVYEPKWDGFRCVLFRDGAQVHLQSRALKDLTPGFPEIVKAARALKPRAFVLDGELAIPTDAGFSFDLLVNRLRLRVTGDRFAREVKATPAIYVLFDILENNTESLLGLPFKERRSRLEQFYQAAKPISPPLYLSASIGDLKTVETWISHIGQQLDGIVAKRADAPYRPGEDRGMVKIKNYRSADCVVGGFRDRSIGSTHNELLLGLYNASGDLLYVGSVDLSSEQKREVGKLVPRKQTPFSGRQPGEQPHWNAEPAGPWKPVSPQKVVEVRFDHFSDGRFRHVCTCLRFRPDKLPVDCVMKNQTVSASFKSLLLI
jgi:ATP-dependent DNA ligase